MVPNKKLTTDEFIERAKNVHNDRFSYEKTVYINNHTKVEISCPEHGSFWQLPSHHLNGCCGCKECHKKNLSEVLSKITTEDFIKRAKEVHGDKYDYSKVEYINSKTKVSIICSVHGEFCQTPSNHLKGEGCPKCVKNYPLSLETFIEKAKRIHGNKFDYSEVNYINNSTKIKIICPKHGEFWMEPANHLNGERCPYCAKKIRMPNEEFIERAKEIYGDKYDYSKTVYTGSLNKIVCTCKKHGDFEKRAYEFLQGRGCQTCADGKHKSEDELFEFLQNNVKTNIEQHKHFKWLGNKHLDIYIPKYKIAIEYQGLQHFKPLAKYHNDVETSKERYERQCRCDIEKFQQCNKNNVKIFYFSSEKEFKDVENYFSEVFTNREKLLENIQKIINEQDNLNGTHSGN